MPQRQAAGVGLGKGSWEGNGDTGGGKCVLMNWMGVGILYD